MQTDKIKSIIKTHLKEADILETGILINEHNNQIESIEIIFQPESHPDFNAAGAIIEDIDNYTMESNYGDLTGCKFEFSTYHELSDECQTISWSFLFDIDS